MTRTASRLMMLAARNGIPVASPRVKDIPETAPSGYAYIAEPNPLHITDYPNGPTFHRTLDDALAATYLADYIAHHGCGYQDPQDDETERRKRFWEAIQESNEARMPHIYRAGMFAPSGCGDTDANGKTCHQRRTEPLIHVVRWDDVGIERLPPRSPLPPIVFEGIMEILGACEVGNPLRN